MLQNNDDLFLSQLNVHTIYPKCITHFTMEMQIDFFLFCNKYSFFNFKQRNYSKEINKQFCI